MQHPTQDAPTPTLRIIPVKDIHPHEVHDPQRSEPLIQRIAKAEYLTNPIIVTPAGDGKNYVVLDGANRYQVFSRLDYPRILAQVVDYASPHVDLHIWQHVVSHWSESNFIAELKKWEGIEVAHGWAPESEYVARLILRNGDVLSILARIDTLAQRNAILRDLVSLYQKNGTLHRSAAPDPAEVWTLYPRAIALVQFPHYQPQDILLAAQNDALLPPGVSRHIIHGRALKVNYPMADLLDESISVEQANMVLQAWLQGKLEKRAIRYYAESTYQFDE
ncbi:ParB N-terminal domain-containing protein [Phototrophicus methaneseepsis]|uniref:ParB N-terminal domain-containing protein n=1 Tax=Phototrophicus methaneseepsis TaxID=2710758 RepID=A0A7S8E676_9CHLR|nr:ParB N-terminal domain-containing protein [Phototrophicus methaneseepsis]QPC81129.1 ParB N-terminal domain-containing protein [Phototrophicus methaneseepsis]